MYYYEVAPNKIIRKESSTFTYASEAKLAVGQLVVVEVGKQLLTGVIVKQTMQPHYQTKTITSVLDLPPLPRPLTKLSAWLSEYYDTHPATVLQTIIPRGITKKRRVRSTVNQSTIRNRTNIVLNKDQSSAVHIIDAMPSGSALLHGVTASGKTRIYMELAKQSLENGLSVIVLVPEIALTSQLVDEFAADFKDIIITHSKQTEAERHFAWQNALLADTPMVIIGPRSALFMPLKSIGLIVIDEAHEPSFKQEQSPRYSALRAASMLASFHEAKLVIGSATPAVADYYLAEQSHRPIITLSKPAQPLAAKPRIQLIDMTKRDNFKKHRFLSDSLLTEIQNTLDKKHQVLLFHNRRGSAASTLCKNCGWAATCERCFVPLTLHADTHQLLCHICGVTHRIPTSCPDCSAVDIIHKGIGTKLIESEIKKIFTHATVARFDGDSKTGESIEARYKELYHGTIDIMIGTQVVAKGLDLPQLRTVGVIQADAGLSLPDYSAPERTFQLLAQAIGRVGRSQFASSAIVQSYQPTHASIALGIAQDYKTFYEATLKERQRADFPPFCHLLKLTCIYRTEKAAISNSKVLAHDLKRKMGSSVTILGPTPAFYERQGSTYRWQLVIKSSKRAHLIRALQYLPPTHWQYELDPLSLL